MYNLIKKILFKFDAENAHDLAINFAHTFPFVADLISEKSNDDKHAIKVANNTWSFPVGLAAGLDKNAYAYDFFSKLGFGAIEVGTVTPIAQSGNEKPRLFRYIEEESIRNCMGFNNLGIENLIINISKINKRGVPLGVNIGKNKVTSEELAHEDYRVLYEKLKNKCDYVVINVSSPNTPGLRDHQTKSGLENILKNIDYKKEVDLFVKIAPDITSDAIVDICELVKEYNLSGIVATNTTIMPERGAGGVSGKLLFERSKFIRNKCLEVLREDPVRELIGVGGFSHFEQMKDYWKMGGKSLQIYSSFIFQGPQILNDISKKLLEEYRHYQVSNFEEYLIALRKE